MASLTLNCSCTHSCPDTRWLHLYTKRSWHQVASAVQITVQTPGGFSCTQSCPDTPANRASKLVSVESLGGRALACIVDIRDEQQVAAAVQKAVETFGGIDVLVNNASAIHRVGTEEMTMKKYDLMNNINTRGTFLW